MKKLTKSKTIESEKDCAQTPWWFMNSLIDYLGINGFDLDACCHPDTAKAFDSYSISQGQDGLNSPWLEVNYCNPPFTQCLKWVDKAIFEADDANCRTAMILPNNPETAYIRLAKEKADTIIEMPFRLKFLRPNGEPFLNDAGKENSPQFSCLVAWLTPLGLNVPTRFVYHDFRKGYIK